MAKKLIAALTDSTLFLQEWFANPQRTGSVAPSSPQLAAAMAHWLPANPDYVIVGPFSDWTKLYAPQVLQQQFVLATQIGPYRVYQRAQP